MLYLTNYRIILHRKKKSLSIPYGYVQEVKGTEKEIKIALKTGINFEFVLEGDREKLEECINRCMNLLPFCFYTLSEYDTPNIYDSYAEIQRMRVDSRLYIVFKNANGKFCPTYPLYFVKMFIILAYTQRS